MLSQFLSKEGLAHETYPMVSQSMNGISFLPGLLIMNRTAPLLNYGEITPMEV